MLKAGDTENVLLRREVAVLGPRRRRLRRDASAAADLPLLRQLAQVTGGEFDAPIRRILMPRGATVTTYRSLDPMLLPLAILLLLADVFVRRRLLAE